MMMNLHLESPVLGKSKIPLQKSTSRHLVFDLRMLTRAQPSKLSGNGTNSPSFFQQRQGQSNVVTGEAFGTQAQTVYKKRVGIPGHPCPACAGQHRPHTKIPPCKLPKQEMVSSRIQPQRRDSRSRREGSRAKQLPRLFRLSGS